MTERITFKTNSRGELDVVSTFQSAQHVIQASDLPGRYWVLGTLVPNLDAMARVSGIGFVSSSGLVARIELFDTIAGALVEGSAVQISNTTEDARTGKPVAIKGGRKYQLFASVSGGTTSEQFAVLRSFGLV